MTKFGIAVLVALTIAVGASGCADDHGFWHHHDHYDDHHDDHHFDGR